MTTDVINKMPKPHLQEWLKALRSGKYKQSKGSLRETDDDGNIVGYCCLGVLEHCLTDSVEMTSSNMAKYLPTQNWFSKHGIECRRKTLLTSDPAIKFGNNKVVTLSTMNDSGRYSFKKIADIIEKYFEGV